jgi:hypothetical protein
MGQKLTPDQQKDLDHVNELFRNAKDALQAYWNKYHDGREGMKKMDVYIEHNFSNPRTRQTEEIEPDINEMSVREH